MNTLLTNNSAMVALETLRGINKDLADVQAEQALAVDEEPHFVFAVAVFLEEFFRREFSMADCFLDRLFR